MALPTLTVEIAFGDPTSAPVWEDVTPFVYSVGTKRGRQRDLDRVSAGTAALVLKNKDGRFDPKNASSPYSPNVLPMRRCRVRATHSAATHDIMHFYIEAWPRDLPMGDKALVPISGLDAFRAFSLGKISSVGAMPQELSGTRITRLLDLAAWPAADRSIDVGQSQIISETITNAEALGELQDIADAENGLVFVGRDGKFVFYDRHRPIQNQLDPTTHTWGDVVGERPYSSIDIIDFDDVEIWNDIRVSRVGQPEVAVSDVTSKNRYFIRTHDERKDFPLVSDSDVEGHARYLLTRFAEPTQLITSMQIDLAQSDDADIPHLLHHDLWDKIRVRRRPIYGGVIEQDSFIQGIEWEIVNNSWRLTWRPSPIDRATDYWVLDDPVLSVLGTLTRLSY